MKVQLKLMQGLLILISTLCSAGNCLAKDGNSIDNSLLGSLLNLLILLVLIGGIVLTLKIHSILKGGELSSVWVLSSLALLILFISIFIEFLINLGVINNLPILFFIFQLLGFVILILGLALFRKKLS